jgi:hypothetical protein
MEPKPKSPLLEKYLPIVEKFFLLCLIIGMVLRFFDAGLPQITFIGLGGLSIAFYLNTYCPNNIPPPAEGQLNGFKELLAYTIMPKILWIGTSILTVGILFYLMKMGNDGYLMMISVGSITVLIGSIVLLANKLMGTKYIGNVLPVLLRSTPALLIGIYIYLEAMK